MDLCVDLVEVTRVPYHELETVYLSVNMSICPNGKRIITEPSFGSRSVKFSPHRFHFIVNETYNTVLNITILSQLTNNRKNAIAYVKIPLESIPHNSHATKSFKTTSLTNISKSPIIKLSIGFNINFDIEKPIKHTDAVSFIDYESCESAPILEYDSFGKIRPPEHYIEKCSKLVEEDFDVFAKLLSNDLLRFFVLNRVTEICDNHKEIIFENKTKKKCESQKRKLNKKRNHSPQPPNEPPNSRRYRSNEDLNNTNNKTSEKNSKSPNPPTISQNMSSISIIPPVSNTQNSNTKSNKISSSNSHSSIPRISSSSSSNSVILLNNNVSISPSNSGVINLSNISNIGSSPNNSALVNTHNNPNANIVNNNLVTKNSLNSSMPNSLNPSINSNNVVVPTNEEDLVNKSNTRLFSLNKKVRPSAKIQQTKGASQNEVSLSPKSYIRAHEQPVVWQKAQPSSFEIEIQKPVLRKSNEFEKPSVKGLLQTKQASDDKGPSKTVKRGIYFSKQKQVKINVESEFDPSALSHSQIYTRKPKPPAQMQVPITTLQSPIENSVNPRRSRQTPEF
ncbi:hypothetical protein TRFO_20372 [Tritrichomonas foetus]|uniref:Uncharacterized protein n=1 Tax=Tritrichomonas foetus TaxID=1144522 RepID=A0A1J4KH86_9EUKA|nr:hypothetical protein TRFO_20372 [Tritrichomonas foetus]|eukprot:OHT10402.1 hypothetical protein TRFO_20372 [Tritrichomonas foetus]